MSVKSILSRRPQSAAITVVVMCLAAWTLAAGSVGDFPIQRVSVSSAGVQANGASEGAAMSANGQNLVFQSEASNLVPGDTNGCADIFLRRLASQQTELVSVSNSGQLANAWCSGPDISPDGRYVAFSSDATNLVASDTNGTGDVFLRDLVTNVTTRISTGGVGPSLSTNATKIAFQTFASLVPNDNNDDVDVYVYDRTSSETVLASATNSGVVAQMWSVNPSISADGRYVAFESEADNLAPGDANGKRDVFVRDLVTGTTSRINEPPGGGDANGNSMNASLSADGRYIVFASTASNLVAGDTNGRCDIFRRDLMTGQTSLVSLSSTGTQGDNDSADQPSISNDGRYVVFRSAANNLVPADTNNYDVFVRDMLLRYTSRISVSSTGEQASTPSGGSVLSSDGTRVAFSSLAWNLVPGDSNGKEDVFTVPAPMATTPPAPPASLAITPSEPRTDSNLAATAAGGSDPYGGTVTYGYQWSRKANGSADWDDWGRDGAVLPQAMTTKGEQWRARARVAGKLSPSTWVSGNSVTIANTPPAPPTAVSATPANGNADTYTIVASASGASDVDSDTLTYQYQWSSRSDGGAWSDWGHDGATLAHADLVTADQWKARARASDGTDDSTWVESTPVSTNVGGTLYVDAAVAVSGDGTTPETAFKTISQAIALAIPGSTIVVAQGTYVENLNFGGKTLSLTSTDPASPSVSAATIIDGGSAGSVVSFVSGESAQTLLSGFTITHGSAEYGGGIICESGAAPVISHCRIQGNVATRDGGGLSCRGASPTITDNTISDNQATGDGGGLHFGGSGTPSAARNIIRDNSATNGAGIVCRGGAAGITDNTIRGNIATQGGGLCCFAGAEPNVSTNNFTENKAEYGGAIYCEGATPTITGNTLSANNADGGAGLYLYNCSPAVTSNTIADNTADDGAGVFGQSCASVIRDSILVANAATRNGGAVYLLSSPGVRLENCTLDGNSATAKGGGVCLDNSPASLHNTIISNSLSGGGLYLLAGALPTVTYCNLFNNLPTDYIGMTGPAALALAASKGNFSQDPGYADRARRDYHPKSQTGRWNALTGAWIVDTTYSPCIDAGDPASAYGKEPQPNGRRINVGAYGNTTEASKAAGLIVAHSPASNATACSRGTAIVISFRWPVESDSVESHLVVASAAGASVKGTYKWLVPSVRVSFTPDTPLEINTVYNVTLTPGTQRKDGGTTNWAENFSFTTDNGPAVILWSPRGLAVTPRARVVVGFDTSMHRPSVENTFRLTPAVAGSFSWRGQQLMFSHTEPFSAGTVYKVSIGSKARSAAGRQLGKTFSWTFTTAGTPASATLTVVAMPTAIGAQISVTLASAADVSVSVRNLAGNEVAVLQPGRLQAGTQRLLWNGHSKSGTKVPSGTYLVLVQARDPQGATLSQLLSMRLR